MCWPQGNVISLPLPHETERERRREGESQSFALACDSLVWLHLTFSLFVMWWDGPTDSKKIKKNTHAQIAAVTGRYMRRDFLPRKTGLDHDNTHTCTKCLPSIMMPEGHETWTNWWCDAGFLSTPKYAPPKARKTLRFRFFYRFSTKLARPQNIQKLGDRKTRATRRPQMQPTGPQQSKVELRSRFHPTLLEFYFILFTTRESREVEISSLWLAVVCIQKYNGKQWQKK